MGIRKTFDIISSMRLIIPVLTTKGLMLLSVSRTRKARKRVPRSLEKLRAGKTRRIGVERGQKVNLFALTLMRGTTLLIVTAANYHLYCTKETSTGMEDLYAFWLSIFKIRAYEQ